MTSKTKVDSCRFTDCYHQTLDGTLNGIVIKYLSQGDVTVSKSIITTRTVININSSLGGALVLKANKMFPDCLYRNCIINFQTEVSYQIK